MSLFNLPELPEDFGRNNPEVDIKRNPYCSISDVEELIHRYDLDLGFNEPADYEKWVGKAIRRAERYIDARTKSTFHKVRRVEWHDGTLENEMILDCYPIIELVLLKVYSAALLMGFDYDGRRMVVDTEAGTVAFPAYIYSGPVGTANSLIGRPNAIGYTFLPGIKNCKFDYWYGWDKVPDSGYHAGIRDAAAMLTAARLLEEADGRHSQGLVSLNVSGQATQYGVWTQRAETLKKEAEPLMLRYERQVVGGIPY